MYSEKPLVTLITVSFNSEKPIHDTIEYIVVDGLSKDKTVSIIKSYEQNFRDKAFMLKIISEKDKGLYDAMNKGVTMANGEIIGILNSDDYYVDELVIEKVVYKMKEDKAGCLYADLQYVDENDKIVRTWRAKKGDFRLGWNPPHPTTFISKVAYNRFGLYKVNYTISSDYDILYRIIHKGKVKVTYLEEFIVKMRTGGRSTSGIKSNIIASKEIYTTFKENKQKFKLLIILIRLLIKVKQFIN